MTARLVRSRAHAWRLAPEALEKLLACLDTDRERAGEKYERVRQKLVSLFRWRGCSTPEDYADRTIDRVARRLTEGAELRIADPYLYFHGVALKVLQEHWRDPERQIGALDTLRPAAAVSIDPEAERERESARRDHERRLECLDACLLRLAPESRQLLLRYHEGGQRARIDARLELARTLAIPLNALRIRVHRIRRGLAGCVDMCLRRGAQGAATRELGPSPEIDLGPAH